MSKLTEEIKRLSRKIDNIDQRVEKIEKKQPKITVKVSTGCDSSVSISNPKFKVGDKFIPHKPKDENEYPTWLRLMDRYDGEILTVDEISSNGELRFNSTDEHCWCFAPSWCTKVEEPKFKKGDWVRSLITGTVGKVEAFYEKGNNSRYLLSTIDGKKFTSHTNQLEPYFPKEGEYVYVATNSSNRYIIIYDHVGKIEEMEFIFDKVSISLGDNKFFRNGIPLCRVNRISEIRPTTSEEKKFLNSMLTARDYMFDGKEIVTNDTPKVGDFCIFWGEIPEKAFCDILCEIHNSIYPFRRDNIWYKNCIKYESVEQFRKIKEGKI